MKECRFQCQGVPRHPRSESSGMMRQFQRKEDGSHDLMATQGLRQEWVCTIGSRKGAITKGCDHQRVRWPKSAITKGCEYQMVRRPRDPMTKGCEHERVRARQGLSMKGYEYERVRVRKGVIERMHRIIKRAKLGHFVYLSVGMVG